MYLSVPRRSRWTCRIHPGAQQTGASAQKNTSCLFWAHVHRQRSGRTSGLGSLLRRRRECGEYLGGFCCSSVRDGDIDDVHIIYLDTYFMIMMLGLSPSTANSGTAGKLHRWSSLEMCHQGARWCWSSRTYAGHHQLYNTCTGSAAYRFGIRSRGPTYIISTGRAESLIAVYRKSCYCRSPPW